MGPLYAYRALHERTEVRPLAPGSAKARFELSNRLDRKIYSGSITIEFAAPSGLAVFFFCNKLADSAGKLTDHWDQEYVRWEGEHLYVTARSNTILEFR